ncbi:hypothetical protein EXIGLDRAFT_77854 [Exidia glandulosa HHB12029]|uniref:Uncharacterized protein n=1 Tax=Exidia glandulosa HHB12029 TaxID=1314781 RepID=A0A165NYL0_EXIGL|nr:hypothetical protein EXIGLDRAFT_77854 [Exidia glandulosa HHB12029]
MCRCRRGRQFRLGEGSTGTGSKGRVPGTALLKLPTRTRWHTEGPPQTRDAVPFCRRQIKAGKTDRHGRGCGCRFPAGACHDGSLANTGTGIYWRGRGRAAGCPTVIRVEAARPPNRAPGQAKASRHTGRMKQTTLLFSKPKR